MMTAQIVASPKRVELTIPAIPRTPHLLTLLVVICSFFWIGNIGAQNSPVGVWRTSDDGSSNPRADIEIYSIGDTLQGKILRFLPPDEKDRFAVCSKCSDDRKDKPMIGLEIMRAIPKKGSNLVWEGGRVLDPDSGKIYKLRLELIDLGKRLRVRGYLGPFYSTEIWERVTATE